MQTPIQAPKIILREYGRNMQSLVEYILTVEDREKRNQYAKTAIELMRLINPNIKDNQEHLSKLWDHLYLMSDYKLDVDSPFPMPDAEVIGKKPDIVQYNTNRLWYKHYGKNVELIIEKILEMEEGQDRTSATIYLGRLMKRLYQTWNKESVEDAVILIHMKEMSKGKIFLDPEDVRKYGLLESSIKDRPQGGTNTSFPSSRENNNKRNFGGGGNGGGGGGDRRDNNFKNRNNNNNKPNNFKYRK
jgi:hypothetical protein